MFRWHRQTCRKPDITIVDNVLFCSSCDSISESPSHQSNISSALPTRTSDPSQSLDLHWPLSVQYSRDGERGINYRHHTLNQNDIIQTTQAHSEQGALGGYPLFNGGCYPPLAQKYDIRLLRISPLTSSGHLHAELDLVDLIFCPSFEALSYTWAGETGNNAKPKSIFIGPFWDIIPITVNCDLALRLLASTGHLSLWVDSICINQQIPHERSHQVSIMREIYSKASRVLVYLGPAADHSDDAMEALNDFSQMKQYGHDTPLSSTQKLGLENLFKRRYFFRIWVIQEFAMAKEITLYCGNKAAFWTSSSKMRVPYHLIRGVPWLLNYIQGGASVMTHPEGLLQLLDATSNCAASDPRDNVFALLGLLRDGIFEGLVPDYCLSTEQVYIGIASYLIIRHKKTNILSYPKGHSGLLPTWVPDWSIYRAPISDEDDDSSFELDTDANPTPERFTGGKGNYFNIFPQDDDHFRINYAEGPSSKSTDIIWFSSGHTAWTLFTTNESQSPRIRYLSQLSEERDTKNIFDVNPNVDVSTGWLNIDSDIVARLDSFQEINPYEFTRPVPFPGMHMTFEWLVRTECPVNAVLDVIANIPGCSSYLHLRRNPTSNHYGLLGNCRMGFRHGVVRNVPWILGKNKFEGLGLGSTSKVADIDVFGRGPNNHFLCASYGFDRSFLDSFDTLVRSRLGKFVVSCVKDRGTNTGDLQLEYLNEDHEILAVWKSIFGWRTAIRGCFNAEEIKNSCNKLMEQLKFWSQPSTWKLLNLIEIYMESIENLVQRRSDWIQIAKVLAEIERGTISWNAEDRFAMASLVDHQRLYNYGHKIAPETASRLGLPEDRASLPCLVSTLANSTTTLIEQLEFESTLFDYPVPEGDAEGEEGGKLSSAERVQLGRIYTKFMRSGTHPSDNFSSDPLLTIGTDAFYSKVQSRVSILKWLRPSWQSFQERLAQFREVCHHISAINKFQESISEAQRISIS
ncbi:HET-domain-containing protein [Jackrogersella minutella]|nr:HET-domain-containing protein [Jackrogersella minutella]